VADGTDDIVMVEAGPSNDGPEIVTGSDDLALSKRLAACAAQAFDVERDEAGQAYGVVWFFPKESPSFGSLRIAEE
jgi:hypothetical protein